MNVVLFTVVIASPLTKCVLLSSLATTGFWTTGCLCSRRSGCLYITAGSVNECTILDTVRAYDTGGELLGAGFFTIEVLFTQTVYTASEEVLTLDTVTGLVENGYNRGRGGRVKFRNYTSREQCL